MTYGELHTIVKLSVNKMAVAMVRIKTLILFRKEKNEIYCKIPASEVFCTVNQFLCFSIQTSKVHISQAQKKKIQYCTVTFACCKMGGAWRTGVT